MNTPPPIGFPGQPTPVAPMAVPAPRGSAWSTTLGIISIVLASIALLMSACNLANVAMTNTMAKFNAGMTATSTVRVTGGTGTTTTNTGPTTTAAYTTMPGIGHVSRGTTMLLLAGYCLNVLSMVLLVVAGIKLLRRRAGGRKLHLMWAVVKFPIEALLAVATFIMTREMFSNLGSQSPGFSPDMAMPMAVMSSAMALVFGLAYPIFLLVALNTRKVKAAIEESIIPATA